MGSDKTRITYNEAQQYRTVVMQQGRVTLDADWNEAQQIHEETLLHETLDIVGPSGTPDDGYAVVETGQPTEPAFDLFVGAKGAAGTMYVGGLRVWLRDQVHYSNQSDWLDHTSDPDWVDISQSEFDPRNEYVYLLLREQEVSAVEDAELRELALGGPDTAARTRLLQHFVRLKTKATDCAGALAEAKQGWASKGLIFDPVTMRLNSASRLQVNFETTLTKENLCEPEAHGGYLGAENQLIRVQVVAYDAKTDQYTLLWGYDNASFLYRVTLDPDKTTLTLAPRPVDDAHFPLAGQAVEVLRAAARLANGEYVAAANGQAFTLDQAYDPDQGQVVLPSALAAPYTESSETPRLFLRAWGPPPLAFTAGNKVSLPGTGLQITLTAPANKRLHVGDYWIFAVRPNTAADPEASTTLYPPRYLDVTVAQPPEGPRLWACPLAVITWTSNSDSGHIYKVAEDCREHFDNLVKLTKRKQGNGCCAIQLRPEDLTDERDLQKVLDSFKSPLRPARQVNICLLPGVYELPAPLRFGPDHSNITLEACHDGVILKAKQRSENAFLDGLVVLNHANQVTFKGLRFDLPVVSFQDAKGKLNAATQRLLREFRGSQMGALFTSIGLRALHCAQFTVQDCLFRFELGTTSDGEQAKSRDLFEVGILAGSECWGLKVQNCEFLHEEDYLHSGGSLLNPFRLLVGYLLAPFLQDGQQPIRCLLEDATFRDNRFAGLTIASLVCADTGVVTFQNNRVLDSFGGFWFMPISTLALLTNEVRLSLASRIEQTSLLEQVLLVTLILGSNFPLPKEFTSIETQSKHGLQTSLHISGNDIAALVTNGISGIGLLIADDHHVPSRMILSNNVVRNSTDALPTVLLAMIPNREEIQQTFAGVIIGNMVLNEATPSDASATVVSLIDQIDQKQHRVVVTGNVFQGITPPWVETANGINIQL